MIIKSDQNIVPLYLDGIASEIVHLDIHEEQFAALNHFPGRHIKNGTVPWADDMNPVKFSVKERTAHMRAGIVDRIEAVIDIRQQNHFVFPGYFLFLALCDIRYLCDFYIIHRIMHPFHIEYYIIII
jgi:hypothetical protein